MPPITPAEAKRPAEAASVIHIEAEIDAYLAAQFQRGNRRPFYDTSAMSQSEIATIVARYRQAGWCVTSGTDRDGPHLVFEEGSTP